MAGFSAGEVLGYLEMLQLSLHPQARPDLARLMNIEARLFGGLIWMWPLGLIAGAVNIAAVYRAVLQPQNRRFASLRIGMQEVWLVVLMLVEALLAMVFAVAAALVVARACVAAARFADPAVAIVVGVIGALGSVILLGWIWLRLSLAGPMTFAERRLRLFESWGQTRGHAGQLLLLALLQVGVLIGVGLVMQALEGTAFALFDPYGADPRAVKAWLAHPPAAAVWAPWVVGGGLVMAIYIGAVRALVSAPWAAAYRDLTRGDHA